jgi:2-dehydro-3-deoxyphosphogluconate aldolase / (4S)-4-hydroxy-2-oxoglutarate aldolase
LDIRDIVGLAPVIPVLTVTDLAHAVPLARALAAGGLRVLEVTMRTPVALAAIEAMRKAVPEAIVGVGTLTRAVDFAGASRAGAQFGVTPGLTPELAAAARGARFPLLPGVMTPTELIARARRDSACSSCFPRNRRAASAMLQALGAPFPDVLVLSDRRNHARYGARLSGLVERRLRGRLLGRASQSDRAAVIGPASRRSRATRLCCAKPRAQAPRRRR